MLRRLRFELSYFGRPPWDRGISPPELEEYVSQHPAGRAIDLGCGTGTHSITLARAGWQVTAIDFAGRAIRKAQAKAAHAGLNIQFIAGDVTKYQSGTGAFELALDIGCFHGVGDRQLYMDNLLRLLRGGGHWLLYGFHRQPGAGPRPGLTPQDIDRANALLKLVWRRDGVDQRNRPSSWFLFERTSAGEA